MEPWSLCFGQHGASSLSWHGNVTIVKMVIMEHVMVHKAFAGNRSTRCGIDESQLLVILSNWTREAIRSGSFYAADRQCDYYPSLVWAARNKSRPI